MSALEEMLVEQLRDAFSAEKQAIQGMKRSLKKITSPELKQGTQAHITQSEDQRARVEQVLSTLGSRPDRTVCEAMRGLVEEAQHEMEEHDKGPVLDLAIVASLQRIEHYEIAAYGTMVELAKALEEDEAADMLGQILSEEKSMDEQLTEVTRSAIMPLALEAEDEEGDEEEATAAPPPKAASKSKRATASAKR
jgi:ferritin-like metal-binding protein YciE